MSKSIEGDVKEYEMYFEYLKHLTTLSTGSIILLVTFLEKIFTQPRWKLLVIISLGGFMISVVASVIQYTVVLLVSMPRKEEEPPTWEAFLGLLSITFTWAGFLTGVISLTVFAMKNLF